MIEDTLAAELAKVRAEQRALYTRAYHLQNALTMARVGADDGVLIAGLAAKGIRLEVSES